VRQSQFSAQINTLSTASSTWLAMTAVFTFLSLIMAWRKASALDRKFASELGKDILGKMSERVSACRHDGDYRSRHDQMIRKLAALMADAAAPGAMGIVFKNEG
jgi:hypothetical protein